MFLVINCIYLIVTSIAHKHKCLLIITMHYINSIYSISLNHFSSQTSYYISLFSVAIFARKCRDLLEAVEADY